MHVILQYITVGHCSYPMWPHYNDCSRHTHTDMHMHPRVPIVWPWCGLVCCVCSDCRQLEAKAVRGEVEWKRGRGRIRKTRRYQDRGERRYREWDQGGLHKGNVKKSKEEFRWGKCITFKKAVEFNKNKQSEIMWWGWVGGVGGSRSQTVVKCGDSHIYGLRGWKWKMWCVSTARGPPFECVCVGWVDLRNWAPGFGRAVQKGYLPGHTIYNITSCMYRARSGQTRPDCHNKKRQKHELPLVVSFIRGRVWTGTVFRDCKHAGKIFQFSEQTCITA